MSYETKVYRKVGGDELVVADGGKITIEAGGLLDGIVLSSAIGNAEVLTIENGGAIDVEAGGVITAAGTQAAHIADAAAAADAAPDKTEFDALVTKFNAVLAALEGVGVLASS